MQGRLPAPYSSSDMYQEKIGYSNEARGKFGPAKWDAAKFELSDKDLDLQIELYNAKKDK